MMSTSSRPNILFFFPDQHRPDFLGGNADLPVRTPNLDGLAAQGVRFDRAFTPSPLCAPARACLASGREYHRCRVPGNGTDYPLDQPTYYRSLREAGYHVAGVGKFDLHKATLDWGLDGKRLIREWGFSDGIDNEGKYDGVRSGAEEPRGPYLAFLHERGLAAIHAEDFRTRHGFKDTYPTPLPEDAYCDNWLAENGLRLLRDFPADRPWHLVINFTGPHNPMDVTRRMRERWEAADFPPPNANDPFDLETHRRIRQNYAAMVENIDRHVGRFLEAVEARGELDNTFVIYSSDHGEMLGDHNRWGKSTYYQPSTGVPLIIAGPGVQQGRTTDALTVLQDLTATILDWVGLPALPDMEGRSLREVLEGTDAAVREHVISALGEWRLIFDGRHKLVLREGKPPLLFDRVADPLENHDLASGADSKVRELTDILHSLYERGTTR